MDVDGAPCWNVEEGLGQHAAVGRRDCQVRRQLGHCLQEGWVAGPAGREHLLRLEAQLQGRVSHLQGQGSRRMKQGGGAVVVVVAVVVRKLSVTARVDSKSQHR